MEFFRIHKTIPFMRFSHILNAISFISFAVAVYWIFAAWRFPSNSRAVRRLW